MSFVRVLISKRDFLPRDRRSACSPLISADDYSFKQISQFPTAMLDMEHVGGFDTRNNRENRKRNGVTYPRRSPDAATFLERRNALLNSIRIADTETETFQKPRHQSESSLPHFASCAHKTANKSFITRTRARNGNL